MKVQFTGSKHRSVLRSVVYSRPEVGRATRCWRNGVDILCLYFSGTTQTCVVTAPGKFSGRVPQPLRLTAMLALAELCCVGTGSLFDFALKGGERGERGVRDG